MIKKYSSKKVIALGAALAIVSIFFAVTVLWPIASKALANAHLKQVTMQELLPLVPAVSDLQDADPESRRQCSERSASQFSYTTRKLWCQEYFLYRFEREPLPESARDSIIQKAGVLDELLKQRGWEPTRPDKTHSFVDAIPSESRAAFHGDHVTYRKEVGDARCLLSIGFSGPTNGISPGVIMVNDFSCMREVHFFSPHIPQFTKQGFMPI